MNAPVADTGIPPAAVLRALADALPGPLRLDRLVPLSGGASAETCALDVTDGAGHQHGLILRRSAGRSGSFNPGVGKREEALTQRAAARHGVAAADVLAVFDADPELGNGYIMRRCDGETLPRRLLRDASWNGVHGQLIADCGQALAAIHRIPRDALPPLPEQPPARQLEQLESMHDNFGQAVPVFTLAFRWLRERLPPERPLQLVHGDFRLGNLMVDGRGLVAVLDWELVHLGDPVEDLGWLCVPAWRFGSTLPAGGFATREALLAAYAAAGGRQVGIDELRFWEVFGTLRWGVICQWQAWAHLSGVAPSVERAAIGRRVTEVELDLLLLMQGKL